MNRIETRINNRRYLGNKYRLLPFIRGVVADNCQNVNIVADIFAGTGAVSLAFVDKQLITNDIMYSNYICHEAWFGSGVASQEKVMAIVDEYNRRCITESNYMTDNFSGTYFSFEDCSKIGFVRQDIEDRFGRGDITHREKALLITSLLYAMDKIANTCGHYDAYRKEGTFSQPIFLPTPVLDVETHENNKCFNLDANALIKEVSADLVYIDPPYNSRQYSDTYHLLENVATWKMPDVYGVARKMDRSHIKSDYCTTKATDAFSDLVSSIDSRYILLSYNNMAKKGNGRSNAKISDSDIMRILEAKGEVQVFATNHKAFSAGKSNRDDNEERLFLCECFK